MSINPDYLDLIRTMEKMGGIPPVAGLYLPSVAQHPDYVDEFGFVFLEDGSVGPFYVSLDDTLPQLWRSFAEPASVRGNAIELARGLASTVLATRALALGAYNALSQHLMLRGGYRPPARGTAASPSPVRGETVGMVGYFCPVIDRLVERDVSVRLLERITDRVPGRAGVELVSEPSALGDCRIVMCTASTLVNDSLDDILAACRNAESFELIGPSGSGLPDAVFARGVNVVGGIRYDDVEALKQALKSGANWGHTGEKYEITRNQYPGLAELLARL
jgi:uncharacterized protein (DUF4213/DUF364 family)